MVLHLGIEGLMQTYRLSGFAAFRALLARLHPLLALAACSLDNAQQPFWKSTEPGQRVQFAACLEIRHGCKVERVWHPKVASDLYKNIISPFSL